MLAQLIFLLGLTLIVLKLTSTIQGPWWAVLIPWLLQLFVIVICVTTDYREHLEKKYQMDIIKHLQEPTTVTVGYKVGIYLSLVLIWLTLLAKQH